jgi:flagella basal body P-ring formation protein FlgA
MTFQPIPRRPPGAVLATAVVAALGAGVAFAMPRSVDPADLRAHIEAAWSASAPAGATLEIRAVPSLSYVEGEPVLEVLLPDDPQRPGPRALPVSCRVDGRVVSRGLANVVLRVERTVWTARRAFERGEEIAPADVRAETLVFEREPTRMLEWDPSRTWRALRAVAAGERLTPAGVRRVPHVEAGTEIFLLSQAGAATVSVPARARQDGDVGDTILVHNPVTGALVRAVVVDHGSVRLVAPGGASREGTR